MTTLSFKVSDPEALAVRLAARRENLTLSEYLRRIILGGTYNLQSVSQTTCPTTGAMIFSPDSEFPAMTSDTVRSLLADFP